MAYAQLLPNEQSEFPNIKIPNVLELKRTPLEGLQRLIMLDRYSQKDTLLKTLKVGDTIITTVKYDPKYPTQGFGVVKEINGFDVTVAINFPEYVEGVDTENLVRHKDEVIKPLELYWEQIAWRNAKGISEVEEESKRDYWFHEFYWMLANMYAIPGGRICYGAGSGIDVTLFNCFVLPFVPDSRLDIINHISLATEVMSRGGGVGSNISCLRPTKAFVSGVNGYSSGAVSWGDYLGKLTHLIEQAGTRRGAQMIGLADWHPDLLEFAICKIQNPKLLDLLAKEHHDKKVRDTAEKYLKRDSKGNPIGVKDINFMTGANISVLASDDLMQAIEEDGDWDFRFPDLANLTSEQKEFYDKEWQNMGDVRKWEALGLPVKTYYRMKARDLWDLLMLCARYSAEPGVIFIDHYNSESNAWYYEPIVVTNPCGEQGLPRFGVCNLIAINYSKLYSEETDDVDWELFKRIIHVSQRFGDNVVDASFYFLKENEEMAKKERRIGKGGMGLADLFIKLKLPYGSDEMVEKLDKLSHFFAVESYLASAEIASEKGSFPAFDAEKYVQSGFMKRLIESAPEVGEAIKAMGVRNVCSLTWAPTGSTGTMVGVAQGLEPYFAFELYRSGQLGKFIKINAPIAEDFFRKNPEATELPNYFVGAMDLTPLEHVKVQGTIQKWVDSSLSKTANAPSNFTVEQTKELYEYAHKMGCKGVTIYVDGSRDSQVLSLKAEENSFDNADMVASTSSDYTTEDLMGDSRECEVRWENGVMIKECGTE